MRGYLRILGTWGASRNVDKEIPNRSDAGQSVARMAGCFFAISTSSGEFGSPGTPPAGPRPAPASRSRSPQAAAKPQRCLLLAGAGNRQFSHSELRLAAGRCRGRQGLRTAARRVVRQMAADRGCRLDAEVRRRPAPQRCQLSARSRRRRGQHRGFFAGRSQGRQHLPPPGRCPVAAIASGKRPLYRTN